VLKSGTFRDVRARAAQFSGSVKGLHGVVHSGTSRSRSLPCRCTAPDELFCSDEYKEELDKSQPKFVGRQLLTKLEVELEIATSLENYADAARLRDEIIAYKELDPIMSREQSLDECIRKERYEEAATLRDELKDLYPVLKPKVPCHSEWVSHGVRVKVRSVYVEDRSNPAESYFFFAYRVRIKNESPRTVRLCARHWTVTDAAGRLEAVNGTGVVGEQPVLEPGAHFEYTSACPLFTRKGTMEGYYDFLVVGDALNTTFPVKVAKFGLDVDGQDVVIVDPLEAATGGESALGADMVEPK